jgi:hypothetical protein
MRRDGVKIKRIAKRAMPGGFPSNSGGDDLLRFILDATMRTTAQSPIARIKLSKLKSKYFRLLNYVWTQKIKTSDVTEFIKEHGGLNFRPSSSTKARRKRRRSGT